jgi:hypothetical protein
MIPKIWGEGEGGTRPASQTGTSAMFPRFVEVKTVTQKKKAGLVRPVSSCVELDAVTSQRGATGAESASGWVRASPVARNVLPQANPETMRGARKQTAGKLQTGCQSHTSRFGYGTSDKLLIIHRLLFYQGVAWQAPGQPASARGQSLAQVALGAVQFGAVQYGAVQYIDFWEQVTPASRGECDRPEPGLR